LKGQIFNLTNMMRRTQEKVRYSEGLPRPMGKIDTDGIKYVNLMILCEAFAVLEDTKGGADALERSEVAKCREIVDKVRERLRQLERILEVRSTAITVQNRQLLKILADTNPELFGSIKGLATVLFQADAMKPPIFFRGKYHEKLQGPILDLSDKLAIERGPIIGLSELSVEFGRSYPAIEYTQEDLEKAVEGLYERGLLDDIETAESGFKILKLKPMKLTPDYEQVIALVSTDRGMIEKGVTVEELMQKLGRNRELTMSILEELSEDEVAWKHESKYYFPGLSEMAMEVKRQGLYVS
ncbi:MAG TPA: hypothetical protein VM050_07295, partial [Patescibacteria group bacterium]|nr:hypothetical protein [Patescibacteria group bacterium]